MRLSHPPEITRPVASQTDKPVVGFGGRRFGLPAIRGMVRKAVVGAALTGMLFGGSGVAAQGAQTGAAGWTTPGIELAEGMCTTSPAMIFSANVGLLQASYDAHSAMETADRELNSAARALSHIEGAIAHWMNLPPDALQKERTNAVPDDLMLAVFDAEDAGRDPFADGTVPNPDAWQAKRTAPLQAKLPSLRIALAEAQTAQINTHDAVKAAASDLKAPAEQARCALLDAGVAREVVTNLKGDAQAIVSAGLAEAWAPQRGVELNALPAADFAIFATRAKLNPSRLTEGIEALNRVAPKTIAYANEALSAKDFLNEAASTRAAQLQQSLPLVLSSRDYKALSSMSPEAFTSLTETLDILREEVGLDVTGYQPKGDSFGMGSELGRLIHLDALRHGSKLSVSMDPLSLFAPGVTHNWDEFVEGAKELTELTGAPFSVGNHFAAAVLGAGQPAHQETLKTLLGHTGGTSTADGYARVAERVMIVARRGGLPENLSADLQGVTESMGRRPSAEELLLIESGRSKGNTGQIVPDRPHGAPASTAIKDYVVLKGAPKTTVQALRTQILEDVRPGAQRSDTNAEYAQDPATTVLQLSRPELLKVRALQRGLSNPATMKTLKTLVEADLANGPIVEVGGLVELDAKGAATFRGVASSGGTSSRASYGFPDGKHSLWSGIAMFHLHAVDAEGDPSVAGPSSGLNGTSGDRWAHAMEAHDGVVVTLMAPGKINVDFVSASGTVFDLGVFALPGRQ